MSPEVGELMSPTFSKHLRVRRGVPSSVLREVGVLYSQPDLSSEAAGLIRSGYSVRVTSDWAWKAQLAVWGLAGAALAWYGQWRLNDSETTAVGVALVAGAVVLAAIGPWGTRRARAVLCGRNLLGSGGSRAAALWAQTTDQVHRMLKGDPMPEALSADLHELHELLVCLDTQERQLARDRHPSNRTSDNMTVMAADGARQVDSRARMLADLIVLEAAKKLTVELVDLAGQG